MSKHKDNDNLKFSSINCPLCRALRFTFFNGMVTRTTEKEIINHLLVCPKCLAEYTKYAKQIHWGYFDIVDIAQKFKDKYSEENTKDTASGWLKKFEENNLISLSRSFAIRKIILNEKNSKFAEFLIKKICICLDILEACYLIKEDDTDAKSR